MSAQSSDNLTQIKQALAKMRTALDKSTFLDAEARQLADDLEVQIKHLVAPEQTEDQRTSPRDTALALEAKFELKHPLAAGFVREIIESLHRMGI